MDARQEAIDKLYRAAGDPRLGQRMFTMLLQRIRSLMSVE